MEIEDSEPIVQYVHAFYFSAVTMVTVGYGDILPNNPYEMTVSCITIMLSCGVFAYSINKIGSIFEDLQRTDAEMMNKITFVNAFMKKKQIPKQLKEEVREYLSYYWSE